MLARSIIYAAVLAVCAPTAWANTGNVDYYGIMYFSVDSTLPTHGAYSAASDFGTNFFDPDPATAYTPLTDITAIPGALAQITGAGYTVSASTTQGSNHAYASLSTTPSNVLSTGGFSGWYDQVTVTGGTGASTGTLAFTVRLSGLADVGQYGGSVKYGLYASSLHPMQLVDTLNIVDPVPLATQPWALSAPLGFNNTTELTTISTYGLGASPYNDTSIFFPEPTSTSPAFETIGIPALSDPYLLDGDMGFPTPDLILTPGARQSVDVTLHGTLTFTYGEAFYLIGGLDVTVFGDGLESFCSFNAISDTTCTIPKDGTGATTLDFSNSANLINIALPQGATASFASGETYNVTSVPEPAEWLMLLAGLGLVGWRARRRS
jgi:hypothetical protein